MRGHELSAFGNWCYLCGLRRRYWLFHRCRIAAIDRAFEAAAPGSRTGTKQP